MFWIQSQLNPMRLIRRNYAPSKILWIPQKGEMKIYENLLKELWIARIKEMMERQSLIIQKRKDEETLKAWRKNMARLKEMTNPEDLKHDFIVPYDVDEDYMMMLSRWELHHPSMRTGRSKTGKRVPCKSVAEEMAEVLAALQKLHEKRFNKPSSPRSEQKALSMEIETLANLQKRLQAIKFRTAKDDMVFSLEKLKSERFKPIIVKGIKTTSDIS
ncbi:uncharacterized protein [Anabrus simplex]|uniref:uncharacterized protein n=1 Tax=Anabrus simplex TaxID=316456 RepID=UPI0035A2E2A7